MIHGATRIVLKVYTEGHEPRLKVGCHIGLPHPCLGSYSLLCMR